MTNRPSVQPTNQPTNRPTNRPSDRPTDRPTDRSTDRPTTQRASLSHTTSCTYRRSLPPAPLTRSLAHSLTHSLTHLLIAPRSPLATPTLHSTTPHFTPLHPTTPTPPPTNNSSLWGPYLRLLYLRLIRHPDIAILMIILGLLSPLFTFTLRFSSQAQVLHFIPFSPLRLLFGTGPKVRPSLSSRKNNRRSHANTCALLIFTTSALSLITLLFSILI
jgi:hypothetical protein